MGAFSNPVDSRALPREYSRHARYSRFARTRYSKQEMAFVHAEAVRLSSSDSVIFAKLKSYTADQVLSAASLSEIP